MSSNGNMAMQHRLDTNVIAFRRKTMLKHNPIEEINVTYQNQPCS